MAYTIPTSKTSYGTNSLINNFDDSIEDSYANLKFLMETTHYFQFYKADHMVNNSDYELLCMAESSLKEDWLSEEEELAWQYLQKET